MAILGFFGAQAFVVLIVAIIGLIPVSLYHENVSQWFIIAFAFLFFAAFATNFENVFLPEVMNFSEHLFGNMGAGIAFAVVAYKYRQQSIGAAGSTQAAEEG